MKSNSFVYLTHLYIDEEYRNLGIGTLFIKNIEDLLLFMNIKNIYLVSATYEDNEDPYRNESFYFRNNFKIIHDFNDVECGKLMYKKL